MHSQSRGATALITLGMTIALLTGCGGPASAPASTPSALTLLPSPDALHSALVATRTLGTARVQVSGTRYDSSGAVPLLADGIIDLTSGMGDLTWTTPSGTYRELVNNRGIYGTTNGVDWTQWAVDDPTPTSGFVNPLRGLGVLQDVTSIGAQPLGSASTTRYTGWLPVDRSEAAAMGIDPRRASADAVREKVYVWIDDWGHALRIDRAISDAEGKPLIDTSTVMASFSLQLDLTSPSENVTMGSRPLP